MPAALIPDMNAILRLTQVIAGASVNDDLDEEEIELRRRGEQFNKDLTAAQRVEGRHGLKKKPSSAVEVGLLIVEELRQIKGVMTGMLDTMRFGVS